MKYISNPEVRLINLNANDVIATSLSVNDTQGNGVQMTPARPAIFDAPVASQAPAANNGGTIWQ